MSDEATKMSLLEMKQAWASSRFFTNNPINKREGRPSRSTHSVVVSGDWRPQRKSLTGRRNNHLMFSFSSPMRSSCRNPLKTLRRKSKIQNFIAKVVTNVKKTS